VKKTANYYWAYGSNLNVAHMRVRCPKARKVRSLVLKDGALVFRGVADVQGRRGSFVPGGLWRITAECEQSLDRYEGVSSGFYEKRYFAIKIGGKVEDVLFYKMRSRGIYPPSQSYLSTIMQGYEDFELDPAFLRAALEEAWSKKRKTPEIRHRIKRRGLPSLAKVIPIEEPGVDHDVWDGDEEDLSCAR
jgi:gamma-glutamylcyclotransferase